MNPILFSQSESEIRSGTVLLLKSYCIILIKNLRYIVLFDFEVVGFDEYLLNTTELLSSLILMKCML